MKLSFNVKDKTQPDPFIFEDAGTFYLYVTAGDGVEVYTCDSLMGQWQYRGIAAAFAAILTAVTTVSLLLYLKISKSEDVRL